jgi:predicted dehydrogenase
LRAGRHPDEPGFGEVPPARWGRLVRGDEAEPVPSEPGRWPAFYEGVVTSLRTGEPPPVDPRDALDTLEILQAAQRSAVLGEVVTL